MVNGYITRTNKKKKQHGDCEVTKNNWSSIQESSSNKNKRVVFKLQLYQLLNAHTCNLLYCRRTIFIAVKSIVIQPFFEIPDFVM